ncbi:MAG: molybdopterin cofactor-binding domain-containing protein, partial [Pseudomonadota bacterium]
DIHDIVTPFPDTKNTPNSGPTVASRTTMVIGKLLEQAALQMKETLQAEKFLAKKYNPAAFKKAVINYLKKKGELKVLSQYQHPAEIVWDDKKYEGDAYPTFAWAVYAAETSTNILTYETKVENFVTVQEVGRVVNKILAEGQIEGGVAQAIGYALYEKVHYQEGRVLNNRLANYVIPTAGDLPPTQVHFLEWNKKYGPGGAKGIGELPMDGTAPAILNAICNALNVQLDTIPLLPEDLLKKVEASHGK